MESIKEILMRRDNMSAEAANELIRQAKESLDYYLSTGDMESAYDICSDYFGLEPDYLIELI